MGLTDAPVWTGAQAAERLRDPDALEALLDAPALVLDLREPAPAPPSLARIPCPVLGLVRSGATSSWPVDLALEEDAADTRLLAEDAEAAAAVLVDAAGRAPAAAAVLAQVLRSTGVLGVERALVAESAAYSLLLTGPEFQAWLTSRPVPRPAAPQERGVRVERDGPVLTLTLERPSVHNAYDASMRDALVQALTLAVLDPSVQRVVLRGAGPSFCSGGDLRDFGSSTDLVRAHRIRTIRHPGALLHQLADRTEARVHGACIGAGVELPAFAARVVASSDSWFQLPEVAMGTIPGAGGTVSLPRRIGAQRALLLALSGIVLPVEDALRWGLVDEIVDERASEQSERDVSV